MSDTPETDAFMTRIRGIDGDKHWVPADTAKRLERERDEWRKKFELSVDAVEIAARLARAESERDEARADAARIADKLSGLELRSTEELERLEQERNEAREIAGRLAHFLERPAYSVDEAIARMEALNSYKKQKIQMTCPTCQSATRVE